MDTWIHCVLGDWLIRCFSGFVYRIVGVSVYLSIMDARYCEVHSKHRYSVYAVDVCRVPDDDMKIERMKR